MAFPTTALVDNFNRSESPLSNGGKWAKLFGEKLAGQDAGEAYGASSSYAEGEDGAYWTVAQYPAPGLAAELKTDLSNTTRYYALFVCLQSPGTEATGYTLRCEKTAEGTFTLSTFKLVKGVATLLGSTAGVTLAMKDHIGISVQGEAVIAWKKIGAGAWTQVNSTVDATYNTGYVGIGMRGNLGRLDNLEAGTGHEHTLSVSQGSSPSKRAAVARKPSVSQPSAATKAVAMARTISTIQAQSQSLSRGATRALGVTQVSSSAVSRSIALRRATSQASSATLRKAVARTLLATAAQAPSIERSIEEGEPVPVVLLGATSTVEYAHAAGESD